ncbi:Flp pilus assembly protein TadG [Microbacterium resistens]|uniref:Flp pilus assembly protein TadG n=1 Tax=Microbacterium resistens TaxID=156977 RepID=A0ABU1S766_9MICO|nr:TadE/TadG family type IV pilus assembly protein [Microbacterium resistens]MDR6865457.1 Flp pilus assembly protein TadG [Microbacterium resistens]
MHRLLDERGSAPVEFLLVGTLLTALTLAVLQLGFLVYVRNIVHDAAVEGAHIAALADADPEDGVERTRSAIARAVGPDFVEDVSVVETLSLGVPTMEIRVRATLPVVGLVGVPSGLEVSGRAPKESFDD